MVIGMFMNQILTTAVKMEQREKECNVPVHPRYQKALDKFRALVQEPTPAVEYDSVPKEFEYDGKRRYMYHSPLWYLTTTVPYTDVRQAKADIIARKGDGSDYHKNLQAELEWNRLEDLIAAHPRTLISKMLRR